jgi:hypothetical protein
LLTESAREQGAMLRDRKDGFLPKANLLFIYLELNLTRGQVRSPDSWGQPKKNAVHGMTKQKQQEEKKITTMPAVVSMRCYLALSQTPREVQHSFPAH